MIKNAEAVNTGKMPGTALGATAKDDKTLVVELEHPVPFLLQLMMHMTTYPVPRHVVEAKGDAWTKPGSYVGNGAFILYRMGCKRPHHVAQESKFYDAANVKIDTLDFLSDQRLRGGAEAVPRRRTRHAGPHAGAADRLAARKHARDRCTWVRC